MKIKENLVVLFSLFGLVALGAIYAVGERVNVCTLETTVEKIVSVKHRTSTVILADKSTVKFTQGELNLGDKICKKYDVYHKYPWSNEKSLREKSKDGVFRI
jgi:hypothetical protein